MPVDDDPSPRKETPYEDTRWPIRRPRSFTPWEALMSAAPGQEPEVSQVELLALREVLNDALNEVLTEEEAWVFNASIVEKMSTRELARQLGTSKSTVSRTKLRSIRKLGAHLQDVPVIREYLGET